LSAGGVTFESPSFEATSELKLQQQNFSAEYAGNAGSVENFTTKSGTNQFHGSLYYFLANEALDATGFSTNALPIPPDSALKKKAPFRQNNFGVTLGGPLKRDRTFFFLSYEGDRFEATGFGAPITQPTIAGREGDFSAWLGSQVGTDALGRPVFQGEVFDPTTTRSVTAGQRDPVTGLVATQSTIVRDPFSSGGSLNVIPANKFSHASSIILPLFPNPTSDNLLNNYPSLANGTPTHHADGWSVKIDHVINDKQRLSGLYNGWVKPHISVNGSPPCFPPLPGLPLNPCATQRVKAQLARLGEDWTINGHTLNHVGIGFMRFANPSFITNTQGWPSKLGLTSYGAADTSFPEIDFQGREGLTSYGSPGPVFYASESYTLVDNLAYLRGKHAYKVGMEVRRYHLNNRSHSYESGEFAFTDGSTAQPGFEPQTGHEFASFILGAANSSYRLFNSTQPAYRQTYGALYFQDDWKFTNKLTLNYGLRWEIPGVRKEAFDRMSSLDPALPNPGATNFPGAVAFLGSCDGCNRRDSFQNSYYREFAPRLGFAYAASNKLVIRGGYGITYAAQPKFRDPK
jgi:hypothetical protein